MLKGEFMVFFGEVVFHLIVADELLLLLVEGRVLEGGTLLDVVQGEGFVEMACSLVSAVEVGESQLFKMVFCGEGDRLAIMAFRFSVMLFAGLIPAINTMDFGEQIRVASGLCHVVAGVTDALVVEGCGTHLMQLVFAVFRRSIVSAQSS